MTLIKKPFDYIMGKGENAGTQHFLVFPQCLLFWWTIFDFADVFILLHATAYD